ncbi:hypothetical protein SAMN04489712_115126 [Thermomonospora echinospora]|uniref:Alpha amylase inhibitor n=1 Tax=Thermomonospora echinospora TaxID=1992 RepID=A0A1H6DC26_9ACTN|nr:hypothetical protein [Thermomonospora echinospora]SEG83027.1 hypothetical protein SAMN04489712_115126 [Thermomonospora echinospora]
MDSERTQDVPTRGRWARRAATMLVGGAIAAGGLAAVAAPAHAAPSGCTLTNQWTGYQATCTEGDGLYRAYARCTKLIFNSPALPRRVYYNEYGEWATPGAGSISTARCPSGAWTEYGLIQYS